MPRDPIIPPMNIAPEELARRLMRPPQKEKKPKPDTVRTRRSRRSDALVSRSDPDT